MKTGISIVVGLVIACLGFFILDPFLVNLVMEAIPASAVEWMGIIKIIVWFGVLALTAGLIITISVFIGGLIITISVFIGGLINAILGN